MPQRQPGGDHRQRLGDEHRPDAGDLVEARPAQQELQADEHPDQPCQQRPGQVGDVEHHAAGAAAARLLLGLSCGLLARHPAQVHDRALRRGTKGSRPCRRSPTSGRPRRPAARGVAWAPAPGTKPTPSSEIAISTAAGLRAGEGDVDVLGAGVLGHVERDLAHHHAERAGHRLGHGEVVQLRGELGLRDEGAHHVGDQPGELVAGDGQARLCGLLGLGEAFDGALRLLRDVGVVVLVRCGDEGGHHLVVDDAVEPVALVEQGLLDRCVGGFLAGRCLRVVQLLEGVAHHAERDDHDGGVHDQDDHVLEGTQQGRVLARTASSGRRRTAARRRWRRRSPSRCRW